MHIISDFDYVSFRVNGSDIYAICEQGIVQDVWMDNDTGNSGHLPQELSPDMVVQAGIVLGNMGYAWE